MERYHNKRQAVISLTRWRIVWLLPLLLCGLLFSSTTTTAAASTVETFHAVHIVRPGDTLSTIAWQHGVTVSELAAWNELSQLNLIFPGQPLSLFPRQTAVSWHEVLPGETLSLIARRYQVSLPTLQQYNQIDNPHYIQTGQRILVPHIPADRVKKIIVSLQEQRTYLYEGETVVHTFTVSTGRPGQETAVGTYYIQNKLPMAYASTWGLQMPYWLGIYWAGHLQNGFHALPIQPDGSTLWAGHLGHPISYGCIILNNEDAVTLYEWADVGTQVIIQP